MIYFAIAELEDGLTVIEFQPGQKAEDAAIARGGILIDAGPYASYEDATDALTILEAGDEEERA